MMVPAAVVQQVQELASWQEPLYQHLHAHPELSMQEEQTRAEIARRLSELGVEVVEVGGGVVGVLRNGNGPTVLLRADFDGLPVREETGLPYASTATQVDTNGQEQPVMHACGHDMHVVAGLGAAAWLAEHRSEWSGTYLALFQPGEETAAGARSMVEAGLTSEVPRPDIALAQHVLASPRSGQVGIAAGPVLSTARSLDVTVFGKGSHGSMPHLGIDPVVLAAAIVTRLQAVVARELAPGEFGVVTVGSLQAGLKANIIPDRARLLINLRAYSTQTLQQLHEAVERIVRAECSAVRSPRDPELVVGDEYPLTRNDEEVTARVAAAFREHFGEDRVVEMTPQTASEDFSTVPDAFGTPYCYWGFGAYTEDQEVYPNHNPRFAPAMQPTLTTGTEAAVVAALAFLGRGR